MTKPDESSNQHTTRREFLKAGTAAAVGTSLLSLAPAVHAAGSDIIKVGIIGCGGRGSQAGENVLQAAPGVKVVALADYFGVKTKKCQKDLKDFVASDETAKKHGNTVDLPDDRCFSGIDGADKVLNSGVDYVILATSPGFRPPHIQAAVAAGKHIFAEKPVAVDGPGTRKVLDAYAEANKKKLGIAAGTQRRHQLGYIETLKQIHDGGIGDIVAGRCHWNNTGEIWFRPRQNGMSNLDYQIHNWYHFVWLCGDHICEQHVHNLDVINWAMKSHPIRCIGMGGRVRPCSDPNVDGHIYQFFSVDLEYPNGVHVLSTCRQVANCDGNLPGINGVSEALVGTKGTCQVDRYTINGQPIVTRARGREDKPYVQEHTDLIESIRAGKPINELKNVAESTLTAIMGRMSAYTGKTVTWDQALNSKENTMPEKLDATASLPVAPVAVPGRTQFA